MSGPTVGCLFRWRQTMSSTIGSEVREARQFEDRDPSTGEVVATVAAGGREDARRAIEAAAAAFPAWAATPPAERQRLFLRAADVLEGRRDDIVELLARE